MKKTLILLSIFVASISFGQEDGRYGATSGITIADSGVVFVTPSDLTLNALTDVDIASAASGNILMRRASGVWVDTSASAISASVLWNAIGDPTGDGTVEFGETSQTLRAAQTGGESAQTALSISMGNSATDNVETQILLAVTNASAGGSGVTEQLVTLTNADNGTVTSALKVQSINGAITTAADLSDTEIVTALALGENDITVNSVTITSRQVAFLDSVNTDGAISGYVLGFNGTSWVPTTVAASGSSFNGHATAMKYFPSTANGADYAVLNSREEVYTFDTTTAETLYVKYLIPNTFTSVDSLTIWASVNSTAGDTVKFVADWLARDDTEVISGAVGGNLSVTRDLGTTALVQHRLTITGSFTGIAAGDVLLVRIYRDPSATNDVAADVNIHDTSLWLH